MHNRSREIAVGARESAVVVGGIENGLAGQIIRASRRAGTQEG